MRLGTMKKLELETLSQGITVEVPTGAGEALPTEFRIFHNGVNHTKKGDLVWDAESGKSVMDAYAAHGVELHIDWEHQALVDPPVEAPAAAWFKPEVRADGLYASDVRWTPRAQERLGNKEYRYFSPAVNYDRKSMRIMGLINMALTNLPATRNIEPLVAASDVHHHEDRHMSNAIFTALGLKDDVGESEALSAAMQLSEFKRDVVALTERANVSEAMGVIASWKQANAKVVTLSAKIDELEGAARDREVNELVDQGKRDGKITPALVGWATTHGRKDIVALRTFLENAPKVANTPVIDAETAEVKVARLSRDQKRMAEALGIDLEKFDPADFHKFVQKLKAQDTDTTEDAQ